MEYNIVFLCTVWEPLYASHDRFRGQPERMSKIVERTLDFIELFAAERRPLSLSDIARLLGIPASSCHDVLRALLARGYIYEIGPRAGFYPTVRLLNLAKTISENDPILLRAEVLLRKIRDTIDESVSLAKAGKASATYLLVFEPSHPLRFIVDAGSQVRSLHATSAGKAFLGSLGPEQFESLAEDGEARSDDGENHPLEGQPCARTSKHRSGAAISSTRPKASTTRPPYRRCFAGRAPITS